MVKKIYYFSNIAAHYREAIFKLLIHQTDFNFYLFSGHNKWWNIKPIDFNQLEPSPKVNYLKNRWVYKGKYLVWQSGVISRCLLDDVDVVILLGEFQVISTWIAVIICKLRGIKTIFWTHGLYGNEFWLKKIIRLSFYRMADNLLLYEKRSKNLLIQEGFKEKSIQVIYNSLDYNLHLSLRKSVSKTKSAVTTLFKHDEKPYLIFIGRLTAVKKLHLLIEALKGINSKGINVNLLIIGDGDERLKLSQMVNKYQMTNYVHFYGECYDENILARLIYHASLCVSPGNIGLTAIHSLSYGTPVCTHNNFSNQMPEVEAIEDGLNGCFFLENNTKSLIKCIIKWVGKSESRATIRSNCYKPVDDHYNPYFQLDVIKKLIN